MLCPVKGTGLDKISSRLLKLLATVISPSVTYLINISLKSGIVPYIWKKAKVTPIHKDGPRSDPSNYRPISVLPILSKILERCVLDQLYQYLDNNNLISQWQSGFRPNFSIGTLTYITESILSGIDSGLLTGIVYIDLKKAFDTVDHGTLLHKLSLYGLQGIVNRWLTDYFRNRTQVTCVNGVSYDRKPIKYGVSSGVHFGATFI